MACLDDQSVLFEDDGAASDLVEKRRCSSMKTHDALRYNLTVNYCIHKAGLLIIFAVLSLFHTHFMLIQWD